MTESILHRCLSRGVHLRLSGLWRWASCVHHTFLDKNIWVHILVLNMKCLQEPMEWCGPARTPEGVAERAFPGLTAKQPISSLEKSRWGLFFSPNIYTHIFFLSFLTSSTTNCCWELLCGLLTFLTPQRAGYIFHFHLRPNSGTREEETILYMGSEVERLDLPLSLSRERPSSGFRSLPTGQRCLQQTLPRDFRAAWSKDTTPGSVLKLPMGCGCEASQWDFFKT